MSVRDAWERDTLQPFLAASNGERKEGFETSSGLEIERLYDPSSCEAPYEEALGYPGAYPYTRGVYPTMYRGRVWTKRLYAGFGTAEETNARFRYLLSSGQTLRHRCS